ncbi:MAG: response regulator [Caulobacteraceae bacterium]
MFEPFFTTKVDGKGTGLGLSMVYGFVKQSNGHIQIYSEQGQGTTVKIYLPRSRQAEQTTLLMLDTPPPPEVGRTILVVEDEESVREAALAMIEELGYRRLEAADAESALAVLEKGERVDLVFTDVVMPGPLRTRDFAQRMRELRPGMPVLFTSGYTDNAIIHQGRLDEGVHLISKPLRQGRPRPPHRRPAGRPDGGALGATAPARGRPAARPPPRRGSSASRPRRSSGRT